MVGVVANVKCVRSHACYYLSWQLPIIRDLPLPHTHASPRNRVAVAPVGSSFTNDEGEEITVAPTTVGGVLSQGLFCDSKMLFWAGGAAGVAAQIPASVAVGAAPPAVKPRPGGVESSASDVPAEASPAAGLFEKKLSKEEKKKLAEERKRARKEAKEAKKTTDES
jgi:hypothetical protein